MKCQYPRCKEEATFRLGLADPDAEGSFYCAGHCEQRKTEIMVELFGWQRRQCEFIKKNGNQCHNAQRFGKLCGVHARMKQ